MEVPVENLLGQENNGFEIIMSSESHSLSRFLYETALADLGAVLTGIP